MSAVNFNALCFVLVLEEQKSRLIKIDSP